MYGRTRRQTINPELFRCRRLIAELADHWVTVAPEIPGSSETVRSAISNLGSFLGDELDDGSCESLDVATLERRHLDRWELDLVTRQRQERSDTRYRYAVHLFALLRRIEDDAPGTLDPAVAKRVRAQTRLQHIRRPGPAEFSTWERRRLIRAAKPLASGSLERSQRPGHRGPSRDELIAVAILLGFGTGEPPEVLRALRVTDITALQSDPSDRRGVDALAISGGADAYLVRYTKRRAGTVYEDVIHRQQRLAHWSITTLLAITATGRERLNSDLLWLWSPRRQRTEPLSQVPWTSDWSLRKWVGQHISGPTDDMCPAISEPITYGRLRKTLVSREAIDDPARYLRTDRRHSAQTFFAHYAASPVLRAHAGKILVEAVEELFQHAVAGPIVVGPDAEQALHNGATTPVLQGVSVERLLDGELDGPLAACRDPLDSPHGDAGSPCPSYANGQCFSCPNAIITSRHLPAVIRIVEILRPERFGRVDAWQVLWGPTYKFLTEVVLPQFSSDSVDNARARSQQVYVDAGLLQSLGGVNEDA